jgi:ubiquinol-cytochrome c reductase cytochrome b subunit
VHIVALHKVGSNNPDGVEIKKKKGHDHIPLDGIPFHPYYTVKDIVGVVVFLMLFSWVIFFTPELGGWFLEHDNFLPANILQTPPEIVPLWYFTPFYTILRATTSEFTHMWLPVFFAVVGGLMFITRTSRRAKILAVAIPVVLILGLFTLEAKVWGVIMMGGSLVFLFFLPWLDVSPVKSVRYRGWLFKSAVAIFVVCFFTLGYLGTRPPSGVRVVIAQLCTMLYFAFFVLMPLYTKIDKTKPVPDRVTWK